MSDNYTTWTTVEDLFFWRIPHGGGCYAAYVDGKLVYIGQSANLRARLGAHGFRHGYGSGFHTPWGPVDNLTIKIKMPRRYGEWAMIELRLIKRLQPPLNCAFSTRKRRINVEA